MAFMDSSDPFARLLEDVRSCALCADRLSPRPLLQAGPGARVLLAGQAPGARAHASGVPFDDASGERLRDWLDVDTTTFYDPRKVAILPMGFCYPGRGRGGDHPPDPRCAATWRDRLMDALSPPTVTLVIGAHALRWHLPDAPKRVTDAVREWRRFAPGTFPLPHPSPRNNGWLSRNPWFEHDVIPALRRAVRSALADP